MNKSINRDVVSIVIKSVDSQSEASQEVFQAFNSFVKSICKNNPNVDKYIGTLSMSSADNFICFKLLLCHYNTNLFDNLANLAILIECEYLLGYLKTINVVPDRRACNGAISISRFDILEKLFWSGLYPIKDMSNSASMRDNINILRLLIRGNIYPVEGKANWNVMRGNINILTLLSQ